MADPEVLPPGWVWARLGDIASAPETINPGTAFLDRLSFSYVDLSAIQRGRIHRPQEIKPADAPSRARQVIRGGDTLFSCVRVYLENVACVPAHLDGQVASTAFAVLRPRDGIESGYLHWLVRRPDFIKQMNDAQRGNSPPAVQDADVRAAIVPVAPSAEQARIVAEVETLFAELDEAEAALARARESLTQFRASLLHAACTGPLTADWRVANPPRETGADLLRRILTERRADWERAELARMEAKGKLPQGDSWKARYAEPAAPNTAGLPELPAGWAWASVEQMSTLVQYGTSAKCAASESGVPVLRMANLQAGGIDFHSLKHLHRDHAEFPALFLDPGDLLFNRTNSAELVGKTAVYEGFSGPCSFASYLVRVKPLGVRPHFVASFINSPLGREWVAASMTQQVGQANVSGGKLKTLLVPLPPLEEQDQIVDLTAKALVACSGLVAADDDHGIGAVAALRQSILDAAFTGRLVPRDPADEPASALLARLRATPATPRRTRRRATAEATA